MARTRRLWASVAVGALFVMTAARADNSDIDPQSEYSRLLKGYQTVQPQGETPFGEQISLYTGDLTFQQTDVLLPGRGPTISLVRSLVSVQADTQLLRPHELGTWTLSIPRIETLTSLPPGDTQPANPGQSWFVGFLANGAKDYARCSNLSLTPRKKSTERSRAQFGNYHHPYQNHRVHFCSGYRVNRWNREGNGNYHSRIYGKN